MGRSTLHTARPDDEASPVGETVAARSFVPLSSGIELLLLGTILTGRVGLTTGSGNGLFKDRAVPESPWALPITPRGGYSGPSIPEARG